VISRQWRGLAKADRADAYVEHLQSDTFPAIRKLAGFRAASILRRAVPGGIEFLILLGLVAAVPLAQAKSPVTPDKLVAPNIVVISPRLTTSGQPSAPALAMLAAQGFEAVIYLAPPTVVDAVRDEQAIVERQGLAYVNIPIKFTDPTEADFDAFVAALSRLHDRKVLVHCQVNLRASSFVFLYRVVIGKEPPEAAYDAVMQVWTPQGPWRALIAAVLRKHGIAFEPY
jgi:protein tyrosine phosphatase (PTP) superfamily phosphohydrolase (DUF442 family)